MTPAVTPAASLRLTPTTRPARRLSFAASFVPATAKLFHAWRP